MAEVECGPARGRAEPAHDAPTPVADLERRYAQSAALARRARRVIPGGAHLSGRPLVDATTTPSYFDRGLGCRIWDVDGHEYVDYLMAFGPFLLGYAHPEVDAAAAAQATRGRLLSMSHPLHARFIEALLPRFPGAEMGIFLRTGSEATSAALRLARRATGRRKVARCGYHGWHDWCLPREDFVPAGLDEQVPEFCANDPATLEALLARHRGEIAAVILAPEMVTPHDPAIFHALLRMTHAHGAVFVMDEVKTALRVAPGSVSARVGITPDVMTVSKALGNGWPVAAVLGRRDVLEHGDGMHYSATFHGDTAAMAAALATLDIVDRTGAAAHVERLGARLLEGLGEIARAHGVAAEAYGEPLPCMPFLRFTDDDPRGRAVATETFYREVSRRGILLHPRHMWFVSLAHTDADVAHTLEVADAAMRVVSLSI
jgi:glutamate-1-semialdehyde aminotransferase